MVKIHYNTYSRKMVIFLTNNVHVVCRNLCLLVIILYTEMYCYNKVLCTSDI